MFQVRTFGEEMYTQFVAPTAAGDVTGEGAVARAVVASLPAVVLTAILVLVVTRGWERKLPPLEGLAATPHVYRLGRTRWLCFAFLAAVIAVLIAVPVGGLVWKLGLGGAPQHWSLSVSGDNLQRVLRVRGRLVLESLLLAGAAGLMTAVLALLTCWLALGTRLFQAGVLLLMAAAWAIPGPIVGLGLKGTINSLLPYDVGGILGRVLYYGPSPAPVLWAYLLRFFPYAVAVLWPVVRLLPRDLREAARVDGAGPLQELRHIVGPLTFPALLRAGLVVMVLSLGELSAGKLLETPGSQTFATRSSRRCTMASPMSWRHSA